MQRLPNVHPSDTVKWPNGIGTFDIGAANDGSKILMYNETPLNLQLDFLNGHTDTLHAWEATYWPLDADTKQIQWTIDPDSMNLSLPPINAVYLTLYDKNETISGQYPISLIRQIGNIGGTQVISTSSTISNEVNIANTLVIDMGVTGNTLLVQIFNDGHFIWNVLQSSVVHQVLKVQTSGDPLVIGQSGDITDILSSLLFINGANNAKLSVDNLGNFNVDVPNGTRIFQFNAGGANLPGGITAGASISAHDFFATASLNGASGNITGNLVTNTETVTNGLSANNVNAINFNLTGSVGNYGLYAGSLSRLTTGTFVSTGGAQAITHSLGALPSCVTMQCDDSTPSTTTHSAYAYTTTQFTAFCANSGVTMRWMCWRA